MAAATGKRTAPIPDSVWNRYKAKIERLYLTKSLDEVMSEMQSKDNFYATDKQYKRKFEKWGFHKNKQWTKMDDLPEQDRPDFSRQPDLERKMKRSKRRRLRLAERKQTVSRPKSRDRNEQKAAEPSITRITTAFQTRTLMYRKILLVGLVDKWLDSSNHLLKVSFLEWIADNVLNSWTFPQGNRQMTTLWALADLSYDIFTKTLYCLDKINRWYLFFSTPELWCGELFHTVCWKQTDGFCGLRFTHIPDMFITVCIELAPPSFFSPNEGEQIALLKNKVFAEVPILGRYIKTFTEDRELLRRVMPGSSDIGPFLSWRQTLEQHLDCYQISIKNEWTLT